ncbi:MAG: polyamine aminopropyltransferase [Acidobacteriota bacterium]|nr:polyamine aminopropyltransferase [Blastocatellia bacterium]MDW8411054.1 polyamine aminopropyltransferase [Acidobacteriota bacterium]
MNRPYVLFLNVLIIATCGLIYELLAGTVASYVLGDSVTHFSLVIGLYLSALGVGSWLSKYIEAGLASKFVEVELGVALLGGFSAPALFFAFAHLKYFQVVLFLLVFAVGVLVGLEIPLLMRILKDDLEFKDLISKILSFDYLGALFASILFPIVLVPRLGLIRTSLLFGLLNALVGLWATYLLEPRIGGVILLRLRAGLVIVLLVIGLIKANSLTSLAEEQFYIDNIIYARTTPYQRIVVTQGKNSFSLFLNEHLQFSSADEYRYHEALVHPAIAVHGSPSRVMILGGGDGLALREVLKYSSVKEVVLVDLDPGMTSLSAKLPLLAKLNGDAYSDPRVRVVNQDAMIWLEQANDGRFDIAIVDFPDPSSFSLGKLYTTRFYKLLKARLTDNAAVAVQATSPLFARTAYWCIVRTLEAAGFFVRPYQTAVPSFGVWGFVLGKLQPFDIPTSLQLELKYLDEETLKTMFVFPRDMQAVEVEVNRLDNQILVRYYESEWRKWEN